MAALVEASIAVEVVPGLPPEWRRQPMLALPLTHRNQSSSVVFVTGHEAVGKYRPQVNWQALAQGAETLVVYMGLHNLASITLELLAAGLSPETPVALIRWGTHPQQQTLVGQLGTIRAKAEDLGFEPPAVAVIGQVVAWHGTLPQCSPQS
jgi:uroporphyrin-III C-methyltransferase